MHTRTAATLAAFLLPFSALADNAPVKPPEPGPAIAEELALPRVRLPDLFGSVSVGVTRDSNASFASSSSVLRINASDVTSSAKPQADTSHYATLFVRHRHDLDAAGDYAIESTFFAITTRHDTLTTVDATALAGRVGYRFRPPASNPGVYVRPYVLFDVSESGSSAQTLQGGAGIFGTTPLSRAWSLDAEAVARQRRNDSPGAQSFGIKEFDLSTRVNYRAAPGTPSWSVFAGRRDAESAVASADFVEWRAGASMFTGFRPSFWTGPRPWTMVLSIVGLQQRYGIDPLVDPSVARRDRTFQLAATLTVPIGGAWSAGLTAGRAHTSSNLPNFNLTNNSLQMGLSYAF